MQLLPVADTRSAQLFDEMPLSIYRPQYPNWVRPLRQEVEKVFSPQHNKLLHGGEAIRWVLLDAQGKSIGRVAAFYNPERSYDKNAPVGGMGFFECINDRQAAFMLLDACKEWLQQRGLEGMDGPVNFGERERWWGLLVEGFDHSPVFCMPYNPPYYQKLFEDYGFQLYFKQYTFGRLIDIPIPERYEKRMAAIINNPEYRFENALQKKFAEYADDFCYIYNLAWAKNHDNFKPMSREKARALFKSMEQVVDKRVVFFAYYKDEPISFFLSLPELNEIAKHLNGNLNWWGKLKFLYYKKTQGSNGKLLGIAFGIIPSQQGKGIESGMMHKAVQVIKKDKIYDYIEMNWIGDFNSKMLTIPKHLDCDLVKTHHTYRYWFDRSRPFERSPMI